MSSQSGRKNGRRRRRNGRKRRRSERRGKVAATSDTTGMQHKKWPSKNSRNKRPKSMSLGTVVPSRCDNGNCNSEEKILFKDKDKDKDKLLQILFKDKDKDKLLLVLFKDKDKDKLLQAAPGARRDRHLLRWKTLQQEHLQHNKQQLQHNKQQLQHNKQQQLQHKKH